MEKGLMTLQTEIERYKHPTMEQWVQVGKNLKAAEEALPWLIGRWLVLGEEEFGKKLAQGGALAVGYKIQTIRDYARVYRQNAGRPALLAVPHSLLREVTPLPIEEREAWVKKAHEGKWSERRLHLELGKARQLANPPKEPTWEKTVEVKRILDAIRNWGKAIDEFIMPPLQLGKFSPEAARFTARKLRDLADRLIQSAKEMEKWAGIHNSQKTS